MVFTPNFVSQLLPPWVSGGNCKEYASISSVCMFLGYIPCHKLERRDHGTCRPHQTASSTAPCSSAMCRHSRTVEGNSLVGPAEGCANRRTVPGSCGRLFMSCFLHAFLILLNIIRNHSPNFSRHCPNRPALSCSRG